jgi:RND family efflux transporter MFP subunit
MLTMRTANYLLIAVACGFSANAKADALACLIQPYQEADIGSQVVGVIDRVYVERGDFVTKGQALVQLNADVERAALQAAKLRAEATAELKAAASNHEFAQKKKIRAEDLYRNNFVSLQASDQASTEAQVAEMRLRQAREAQRLAQQALAQAEALLTQRTIKSPLSGVVVERYLSEGERVENKPVLKVATVDPLKVEVIVPASYFSKIKHGMSATVRPDLADVEARTAKVVVVDRVIDPASNSFRVRLELPNPNNSVPPGLRCKVAFDFNTVSSENAPQKPAAGPSVAAAATK